MSGTGNPNKTVAATGSDFVDGVLAGAAWSSPLISYNFPSSYTPYAYSGYDTGFASISAMQETAAHRALDTSDLSGGNLAQDGFSIEGFTNLGIVFYPADSQAEVRIAESSTPATAAAWYPGMDAWSGDVWFGNSQAEYPIVYRAPEAGNYSWLTMFHEIGHAMGLKHGHETGGPGNTAIPSQWDSMEYSVMTYRSYVGASTAQYFNEPWGYAQSYMMADIAALQEMYGADYTTNSGNTVYKWNPGSGDTLVNGQVGIDAGGNRIFATIWDGGGKDTYDLTAYSTDLVIDLRPGGYSKFSDVQLANLGDGNFSRGNIFNALLFNNDNRSLIENAKGGSGNDFILGNDAKNTLKGNNGKDTLKGEKGNDKLFGGNGKDKLFGGGGKDKLDSGKGNDKLKGNGGNDKFVFKNNYDKDKVLDFKDNRDTIVLDDNLWNGTKSVNKVLNQFGTQNGSDFVFDFGGGDILTIKNTTKSQLQNDIDFI
jgi:serralysin